MIYRLGNLVVPSHIDYLILDRDLSIQLASPGAGRFVESAELVAKGQDIRNAFLEVIGVEEILIEVLEGQQESFDIKGIGRTSNPEKPSYIDLYFQSYQVQESLDKQLIVFLEDVTERMQLEQRLVQATNETSILVNALYNSEKYINGMLDSMAEVLLVTTQFGKIKKANKAAERLLGYSKSELINNQISLVIGEDNLVVEVIKEGSICEGEFLNDIEIDCRTKKGDKISVSFSCSTIKTEVEGVKDAIYIGRDITNIQRAQKRLIAQYITTRNLSECLTIEQSFPKVLQTICENLDWDVGEVWMLPNEIKQASDSVLMCVENWIHTPVRNGEFITATKQMSFRHGVGLQGRIWASCSPHWITDIVEEGNLMRAEIAEKEGLHAAFGFPIQSDSQVLGVMTFFSRDRKQVDEQLIQTAAVIGSQLGEFIKRKQAELALQESKANLAEAQAIAHVGSWTFEIATEAMTWSEEMFHIFGLDPRLPELGYREFLQQIYLEDRTLWDRAFRQAIAEGSDCEIDFRIIRPNGSLRHLNGKVKCVLNQQKEVLRLFGTVMDITERKLAEIALAQQQKQTEKLLLNILPKPIAEQLKQGRSLIAESFEDVTVLFADIVGFTELSARISPRELLESLNLIFSEFDRLTEQFELEKIKTIGDAYMAVGGVPTPRPDHAEAIAYMALEMLQAIGEVNVQTEQSFNIRIGINTGPVIAGVIGTKKFIYDLWGDTVNTASRMEYHGIPGVIQVTETTRDRLQTTFAFEPRGTIEIKGKGQMKTYILTGKKNSSNSSDPTTVTL